MTGSEKTLADLRSKPWNAGKAPASLYRPKGMLGEEERRALYWIGKEWFDGRGAIVDAGAYVGASAFCLAEGVAENRRIDAKHPCIFSYDYFRAIDEYVAKDIETKFRPMEPGGDYLDIFLAQTRRHNSLIEPIAGDFTKARWDRGPIEILFVDVAKTPALNSHLMREFFSHLIPGRSLVVHQDFYHCWHPYIHITMQILSPYFEVADEYIPSQSRLYLHTKPIPPQVLSEAADYKYPPGERLALLDAAAARETGDMRAMIEVAKLWQLVQDGDLTAAMAGYSHLKSKFSDLEAVPALPPPLQWWERLSSRRRREHRRLRRAAGTLRSPLWWQQAGEVCERMANLKVNAA